MIIRPFRRGDVAAVRRVFFRAVREGAAGHYSEAQRRAWAPRPEVPAGWADWLGGMTTLVAEEDGEVQGFMALDAGGHLDMAFVLPERMGQGLADDLLVAILAAARTRGHKRLTTEASFPARSFFLRNGWTVEAEQAVEKRGIALTNFRMQRDL